MRNVIKAAFLSSIITAAMVYVILEWKPLRPEASRPPEVSWASPSATPGGPPPAPVSAPPGLSDDEKNNVDLYQKYGPSVVNITTTTLAYDFFFRPVPESGTGSGAIIDTDGHIVTNHHVVAQAQQLEVTLWDKTKYKGKIIGDDPNHDLAVIQITAPKNKLKPIPFGSSQNLLVGQKVLAIGNPYGLERTLTIGIISSLGRSIQTQNGRVVDDVIQTDAAINPGNSGGPLLNTAGEIIGINTAIVSESGSSAGIGFAIPSDVVKEISGDLVKLGYVPHPWLGVYRPIPLADYQEIAQNLRLNTDHGLLVTRVLPNSPASRAGIRESNGEVIIGNFRIPAGGDVILALQGRDVLSQNQLTTMIEKFKPGERVTITVLRDGRQIDLQVVLTEAPRQ
jgi:S1-C subfamily serine protease